MATTTPLENREVKGLRARIESCEKGNRISVYRTD